MTVRWWFNPYSVAVATYLYQSNISSVQFPYTKSLVKPWLNQRHPPPPRPPRPPSTRALSFGIKSSSFTLPPKLYTLQVEKQTANPSILYLKPYVNMLACKKENTFQLRLKSSFLPASLHKKAKNVKSIVFWQFKSMVSCSVRVISKN